MIYWTKRVEGLDEAAVRRILVEAVQSWTERGFCDSSCGAHQGDPVATDFACCPTHEMLHDVLEEHPEVRAACLADDGVIDGLPEVVYDAFDYKRQLARTQLRHESHMGKLTVTAPPPTLHRVPTAYAGLVQRSMKLGGLRAGYSIDCSEKLEASLRAKLQPSLANIDHVETSVKVPNATQLRLELVRDCAAVLLDHAMRGMRPSTTLAAAVAVDTLLEKSLSKLLRAEDTPEERRKVVLEQLFLARNKGGAGVHKHVDRRDSQWVGFVFKAWPSSCGLRHTSPSTPWRARRSPSSWSSERRTGAFVPTATRVRSARRGMRRRSTTVWTVSSSRASTRSRCHRLSGSLTY